MVMFDVVEAILLRCLPKDLLRCKSVCKSWYSLISSPSFAKTHAELIICNKEEDNNIRKIAMIETYYDRGVRSGYEWVVIGPGWAYYSMWRMEGSCNGLVCISRGYEYHSRIIVTNPLTREFREIKRPPKRKSPKDTECLGFGYDPSTDDYKVVMAICDQGSHIALVRILSLKANVWKVFGQVKYRFDDSSLSVPGILFNGALHWLWVDPSSDTDTTRKTILLVSFDLAEEEFREIPQPDDKRYVWNYGHSLGIIQGRLCIFPAYVNDDFPTCGTWVMKSYNSWQLFPYGSSEMMKDHAIHYMLKDTDEDRITPPPTYFCDDNTHLSRSTEHIPSPLFVQTIVSPYGGPTHAKNNKNTATYCWECSGKIEIQEVYNVEDKEEGKEIAMGLLEVEVGLN